MCSGSTDASIRRERIRLAPQIYLWCTFIHRLAFQILIPEWRSEGRLFTWFQLVALLSGNQGAIDPGAPLSLSRPYKAFCRPYKSTFSQNQECISKGASKNNLPPGARLHGYTIGSNARWEIWPSWPENLQYLANSLSNIHGPSLFAPLLSRQMSSTKCLSLNACFPHALGQAEGTELKYGPSTVINVKVKPGH